MIWVPDAWTVLLDRRALPADRRLRNLRGAPNPGRSPAPSDADRFLKQLQLLVPNRHSLAEGSCRRGGRKRRPLVARNRRRPGLLAQLALPVKRGAPSFSL